VRVLRARLVSKAPITSTLEIVALRSTSIYQYGLDTINADGVCSTLNFEGFVKSASSVKALPWSQKFVEGVALASLHFKRNRSTTLFHLDDYIQECDTALAKHNRRSLRESKVVEIGFGARPFRLVWLYNSGIDVWGVDLDKPLVSLSAKSVLEVLRNNGPERALKSLIRYCITDRNQWSQMASGLSKKGRPFRIPTERLLVNDAADPVFWNSVDGPVDFIYSEDVFEHIPRSTLEIITERMAEALRTTKGLAMIRPMMFNGICGSHRLDWYEHSLSEPMNRKTEPWEHLRQDRFPANTYLNRLNKQDYMDIFSKYFRILESEATPPNLGVQFMTKNIRVVSRNL
jgi:hypothetical protein